MVPTGKGQQRLFGKNIEQAVREAIDLRQRLHQMPIRDIRDVKAMARLDADVRQKLGTPECIADAFIGDTLSSGGTDGCYGLLATSNIAEGSAIKVGLGVVVQNGVIPFAKKGMPWPGKAAVVVAIIGFIKGEWQSECDADDRMCARIGPQLEPEASDVWLPESSPDAPFSFAGVDNSKGLAFIATPDSAWFERLQNEADSLLRPHITGDDITSSALNRINRWALDIGDRGLDEIARRWPNAHRFILEEVQPTRTVAALKSYKGLIDRWWQFWNHRADLTRHPHPEFERHDDGRVTSAAGRH